MENISFIAILCKKVFGIKAAIKVDVNVNVTLGYTCRSKSSPAVYSFLWKKYTSVQRKEYSSPFLVINGSSTPHNESMVTYKAWLHETCNYIMRNFDFYFEVEKIYHVHD